MDAGLKAAVVPESSNAIRWCYRMDLSDAAGERAGGAHSEPRIIGPRIWLRLDTACAAGNEFVATPEVTCSRTEGTSSPTRSGSAASLVPHRARLSVRKGGRFSILESRSGRIRPSRIPTRAILSALCEGDFAPNIILRRIFAELSGPLERSAA